MRQRRRIFLVFLLGLMLFPAAFSAAQDNQSQYARRFQNGAQLYGLSRWHEAAIEFRRAQENAQNMNDWSQSLYWVILSQLAYSDYGSALRDMDELDRRAPNSTYTRDMVYHRARVYLIQGYFEEALILFNRYNSSVTDSDRQTADRRAAAFFWMGECLFSMVQYEEAEKFYSWVIARYPQSPKVEAAAYRIDLIKQKKIETELLALLQLSHEESLRTSEDYQRTIRTYEHILSIYQRRIAELANSNNVNQEIEPEETHQIITQSEPQIYFEETLPADNFPTTERNGNGNDLVERAMRLENHLQELLQGGAW